ncbi:hypothetical protein P4O66_007951 [Electrophorus voltai]|uniref:Small monomeric GTPase n=1 Tax=Electrophorus voltai TaxID=2609070 RepID=A0AAD8ZF34_9TELE|nr:hypothetical protein P4O66_007951 [Electrophorus voltai]
MTSSPGLLRAKGYHNRDGYGYDTQEPLLLHALQFLQPPSGQVTRRSDLTERPSVQGSCKRDACTFQPQHGVQRTDLQTHYNDLQTHYSREQFHGLGSMYCRGAAAVILTYDVTNWQSYAELEDRFLSLTDTANPDCIFAIVGNKADLTDSDAHVADPEGRQGDGSKALAPPTGPAPPAALQVPKQVNREDAMALYARVLRYKDLEEKACLPAGRMCFETSAKTGYNVDALFESLFDMVLPAILKRRNNSRDSTVDLDTPRTHRRTKAGCCD